MRNDELSSWLENAAKSCEESKFSQIDQYVSNSSNFKLQYEHPQCIESPNFVYDEQQCSGKNIVATQSKPDVHSFVISPLLQKLSLHSFSNIMSTKKELMVKPIPLVKRLCRERCMKLICGENEEKSMVSIAKMNVLSISSSWVDMLIEATYIHKLKYAIILHVINHILMRNQQVLLSDRVCNPLEEIKKDQMAKTENDQENPKEEIKETATTMPSLVASGYCKPCEVNRTSDNKDQVSL